MVGLSEGAPGHEMDDVAYINVYANISKCQWSFYKSFEILSETI